MKLVISFNIHDNKPKTRAKIKGLGLWLVVLHAENLTERITIELENKVPCDLFSLHELIMNKLNEAAGDLSPITDGGYHIYQKSNPNV